MQAECVLWRCVPPNVGAVLMIVHEGLVLVGPNRWAWMAFLLILCKSHSRGAAFGGAGLEDGGVRDRLLLILVWPSLSPSLLSSLFRFLFRFDLSLWLDRLLSCECFCRFDLSGLGLLLGVRLALRPRLLLPLLDLFLLISSSDRYSSRCLLRWGLDPR